MPFLCQEETWDQTIPKNIYCPDDESCSSIGSFAESSLDLTYSEDGGSRPYESERWNCDLRVEVDDFKQPRRNPRSSANAEAMRKRNNLSSFPDLCVFQPFAMSPAQAAQHDPNADDNNDDDAHSSQKLFSVPNVFRSRRISSYARMEMLHHQISKPFRAWPFRCTDVNSLGKKILKSAATYPNITALDCSKSRKIVRITREQDAEKTFPVRQKVNRHRALPVDTQDGDEGTLTEFPPFLVLQEHGLRSTQKGSIFQSDGFQWVSQVPTDESSDDESAIILAVDLG